MKTAFDGTISEQDILDFISSGIIATDKQGLITYLNDQTEVKFNIKANDYTGRSIAEILPLLLPVVMECLSGKKLVLGRQIPVGQGYLVGNPCKPYLQRGLLHYRVLFVSLS